MTPHSLIEKYEQALATQRWENVEPLMHDDVCVTFSSGTFRGKQAVQGVFQKNFATIQDEKYSIANLHWAFLGKDTAVCLYSFHWRGLIAGQAASGRGRGTSTLIRQDGSWLMLAEHLGPEAAQ